MSRFYWEGALALIQDSFSDEQDWLFACLAFDLSLSMILLRIKLPQLYDPALYYINTI